MFIKLFLLATLLPSASFALSCGDMKEGEVVRIDRSNGTLESASIQDQDGLGTCYANQASLLLQSVIPNNPNLSYLNLALYSASDYSAINSSNGFTNVVKNPNEKEEHRSIVDTGFTCNTINSAIKRQEETKSGVLCKASDAGLEHSFYNSYFNASEDKLGKQKDALIQASKYLLSYKEEFGYKNKNDQRIKDRAKADAFANALSNLVKNNANDFLSDECSKPDNFKIKQAISNGIARSLDSYPQCLNGTNLIKKGEECLALDSLGTVTKINDYSESRIGVFLKIKVIISIDAGINNVLSTSKSYEESKEKMMSLIAQNIPNSISNAVKEKIVQGIFDNMLIEDDDDIYDEFKKIALGDYSKCIENKFLTFFYEKDRFLELAKKDPILCNYQGLLENAGELASILPPSSLTNITNFVDFLTVKDRNFKYDTNLLKIVASDCRPSDRVIIPKDVKCQMVSTELTKSDLTNKTKLEKHTLKTRRALFGQLSKNLPVGIDLCTRYWFKKDFELHAQKTQDKYDICRETGTNGIHAITMIGYRCQAGQIEYLAQNSWGPNWKLEDPSYQIEDGKIWLNEDKLIKNLIRYNTITK